MALAQVSDLTRLHFRGRILYEGRDMKEQFKAEDAYKYLDDITGDHAIRWAKVANADYARRMALGSITEAQARQFAVRYACKAILGKRPYEQR
jgi:hypothetical protein